MSRLAYFAILAAGAVVVLVAAGTPLSHAADDNKPTVEDRDVSPARPSAERTVPVSQQKGANSDADAKAAKWPRILAAGEWSAPVADTRGYALRGRLVLGEKRPQDDLREVVVYVDLQDVSDFVGHGMQLYCDLGRIGSRPGRPSGLHCELRDKEQRLIEPKSYPFGGAVPKSEWIGLPCEATIRLRTSPFGVRRAKTLAITPVLNELWEINDDDSNEYLLSGSFTMAPADDRLEKDGQQIWRGTLTLPAVRIRNDHSGTQAGR
jgi:hypothetical protein